MEHHRRVYGKSLFNKNGVVVHTSNPNLFLADGWTYKHNNPEAKKPVGRKYGKKKKTTK